MLKPYSLEHIKADGYRPHPGAWDNPRDHRADPTLAVDAPNQELRAELTQEFKQRFGVVPRIFRAPGRVNLIGEHTDYNQGFVMPAAIDKGVWAAVAPRADRKIVMRSRQFEEQFEFNLDEAAGRRGQWTDYVQGVAIGLRECGSLLSGASILIHGEVPLGAGLSSSAALETATGFALMQLAGVHIASVDLAKLCQRAENEFVGARCGIMDQFISCLGERAHCMMIDCRSLEYSRLRIPDDVRLVACNTMVKHEIAAGEYNLRRAQCEEGVTRLARMLPGITSLRDVSPIELQQHCLDLPKFIRKRCWHVVSENQRVQDAAQALRQRDMTWFGELMRRSHCSLRDNYEVSCRELDLMVEIAARQKGVYGARMTGGGFGGCTINLVHREATQQFQTNMASEYEHLSGVKPEIYVMEASSGVSEVL